MSLNSLLSIGRSALSSQQRRIQVIQNNVANASTPGYRRQRINLETLGGALYNADVKGVNVANNQSINAPLLDRQIVLYSNGYGYHSSRAELGSIAEGVLNPVGGVDLDTNFTDFFDKLRALEVNPSGTAERMDLLASAEDLAQSFSRVRSGLDEARREAEISANDLVADLNVALDEVARLDDEIQIQLGQGNEPHDLVDRRDQIIAELSAEVGVRSIPNSDGRAHLVTPDGVTLVEGGNARSLELVQQASGELTINVLQGAAQAREIEDLGGQLGGLISGHNELLNDSIAAVDQLAFDFANGFNAIHQAGMGLDGSTGQDFFDVTATADGAAQHIEVAAAILADPQAIAAAADATEIPGGNSNLINLIAFEDTSLSTGNDLHGTIQVITQDLAETVKSATNEAEASAAVIEQLSEYQASVSGVSLEEEMINLTESQNALEASLKLIQAADEMMESILTLKS